MNITSLFIRRPITTALVMAGVLISAFLVLPSAGE